MNKTILAKCDRCGGKLEPLNPGDARSDEFHGWCDRCQDFGAPIDYRKERLKDDLLNELLEQRSF